MSVETKAKFVGKLDVEALLGFIKGNIYPYIENTKGVEKLTSGFIYFTYNGEARSLHYSHRDTVWLDKDSFERNIKNGTPELNGEVTELSLGFNATAVEVMKKVVEFFDGYIQEKDCSGKWFHKVKKG